MHKEYLLLIKIQIKVVACEKYMEPQKEVFLNFIDLMIAYVLPCLCGAAKTKSNNAVKDQRKHLLIVVWKLALTNANPHQQHEAKAN